RIMCSTSGPGPASTAARSSSSGHLRSSSATRSRLPVTISPAASAPIGRRRCRSRSMVRASSFPAYPSTISRTSTLPSRSSAWYASPAYRDPASRRWYRTCTFSFNAGTGRCPTCGGNGFEHVEMQFLSDVYLRCPDCNGTRYRADVLDVTLQGKSIADVLDLTVGEARAFFGGDAEIAAALRPLAEVGLDYLKLGQPVPTLSGGEAQRLKLAGFLSAASRSSRRPRANDGGKRGKLFLFDEPTTGLHFDDVARLLRAFRKLLAAGHTLVVIEHNLDVIRAADWIVDLGPEGGDQGGRVIVAGTVAEVTACPASHTGAALRGYEAA